MQTLEQLRYLIAAKHGLHEREYLRSSHLPQGIPRGAITQICGFGKTEAAVQLIKQNSDLKAAWIESEFELNPFAIAQREVDLTRILFAEAGEHMVWTAHQILKSHLFPLVILKEAPMEDILLRKLQLAAEKAQSALIILTEDFSSSWPVSLMIKAHRNNTKEGFELEVLRQKL